MGIQKLIWESAARFRQDENGATAIEYALVGGLISIVIVAAVTSIGNTLSGNFSQVVSGFN